MHRYQRRPQLVHAATDTLAARLRRARHCLGATASQGTDRRPVGPTVSKKSLYKELFNDKWDIYKYYEGS